MCTPIQIEWTEDWRPFPSHSSPSQTTKANAGGPRNSLQNRETRHQSSCEADTHNTQEITYHRATYYGATTTTIILIIIIIIPSYILTADTNANSIPLCCTYVSRRISSWWNSLPHLLPHNITPSSQQHHQQKPLDLSQSKNLTPFYTTMAMAQEREEKREWMNEWMQGGTKHTSPRCCAERYDDEVFMRSLGRAWIRETT